MPQGSTGRYMVQLPSFKGSEVWPLGLIVFYSRVYKGHTQRGRRIALSQVDAQPATSRASGVRHAIEAFAPPKPEAHPPPFAWAHKGSHFLHPPAWLLKGLKVRNISGVTATNVERIGSHGESSA